MKVFAAHNPDPEIRRQSSSGGIFTILSERVLWQGGVVYGVAFDGDWNVAHRRVDSFHGLAPLRGSKYVYSNVGTAYADAAADLKAGRQVLFSGTPCQIAAMRRRAGENLRLILVEIVCHGAPAPEYWSAYLSELCKKLRRKVSDIASINFRDKRTGWKNYSFTVSFRDGKTFTQPHDDNLYMRAFLKDLTLREACFRCPFKHPGGSQADITLGDLWGISQLAPEIDNDQGTTLVIARQGHIQGLVPDAYFVLNDVAMHNPAIVSSANRPAEWGRFQLAARHGNIIALMRRFAGRPFMQDLYLRLARIKNKLIRSGS